jgi:hypothetical protein
MQRKIETLTEHEKTAARMLVETGRSIPAVAEELGIHEKTLLRRSKLPAFISYQATWRKEMHKAVVAQVRNQIKEIDLPVVSMPAIMPAHLIAIFWEFATMPKELTGGKVTDQIAAAKELWRIHGFDATFKPGGTPDGDQKPKGPDVFEAEWLRKPQ